MISYGITLILLSVLAVPSLILSKKPDAQQYLDKLVPYQGWFGVVCCIWGVWGLISCLLSLDWLGLGLGGIITWFTWLLCAVVEATLGFILGYGLIAKYAFKGEKAQAKGEQILMKLAPVSGKLGILGIIMGLWCIVAWIVFW